jgi:predicted nucleotidyltransferase
MKKEETMNVHKTLEIKRIVIRICEEMGLPAEKIIMFGSRARGDFTANSDWDFLIVLRKTPSREEKRELAHRIRRELAEHHIPCDVVVKSLTEVEERERVIGSVIRNAIKEGVIL